MLGKSFCAIGLALILGAGVSVAGASTQPVTDDDTQGVEGDSWDTTRDRPEHQRDPMTDEIDLDGDEPADVDEVLLPEPEPREDNGNDGNGLFAPPGREDDPALLK